MCIYIYIYTVLRSYLVLHVYNYVWINDILQLAPFENKCPRSLHEPFTSKWPKDHTHAFTNRSRTTIHEQSCSPPKHRLGHPLVGQPSFA